MSEAIKDRDNIKKIMKDNKFVLSDLGVDTFLDILESNGIAFGAKPTDKDNRITLELEKLVSLLRESEIEISEYRKLAQEICSEFKIPIVSLRKITFIPAYIVKIMDLICNNMSILQDEKDKIGELLDICYANIEEYIAEWKSYDKDKLKPTITRERLASIIIKNLGMSGLLDDETAYITPAHIKNRSNAILKELEHETNHKIEAMKCVHCGSECTKGENRWVCPEGHAHPDGDYSYLCGSIYCRCCQ